MKKSQTAERAKRAKKSKLVQQLFRFSYGSLEIFFERALIGMETL